MFFASVLFASLRSRLILMVAIFFALVLLLVGGIAYLQSKEALREVQARNLEVTSERLATDIDDRVRSRRLLLEQAAASLQLDATQFEQQSSTLVTRFRYLKGMFNSVLFYDLNGNIVADYPVLPGRRGQNVADREYFSNTRRLLLPQVSEPIRVRGGLSRTVIVFTAPVFNAEGQLAGVLGAALELYSPELFGELKNIDIGKTGHLTINSVASRLTILHPDPSHIMQPSQDAVENPLLHRAFAGWQGRAEALDTDGVSTLVVYRRLQQVPWVIGAALPMNEVMQPAIQVGQQYLLLVLLAIALGVPLASWGMRKQLLPLQRLQNQIAQLQENPYAAMPGLGCTELEQVGHDVADAFRRRADGEAELTRREQFFRSLNDVSPMGVFVIDEQARFCYLNPACIRIGGLDDVEPGEWEGRHWLDAIHQDSLPQLAAKWQQLRLDGQGFELLCRVRHRGGKPVMAELRMAEVGAVDGDRRFIGVLSDVSEREQAQASLQAERERALLVLATINDAVVLSNRMDEIEFVNGPAVTLFGLPASDMLGRLLSVFVKLARPESGVSVSLLDLEREHGSQPVELDLLSRDMQVMPVVVTLSVIAGAGVLQGYKVLVLHDDAARRGRERQHRWDASHDGLTGLVNRRGFLVALNDVLADNLVRYQPHMLAMVDLDHFKQVNDSFGHQGGDLLLQDVARIMRHHVRPSDVVARLGGDEFAILFVHCQPDEAARMLKAMLQAIDGHRTYLGDQVFHITASIGVAQVQENEEEAQTILARADALCYQAKNQGRNCVIMPV